MIYLTFLRYISGDNLVFKSFYTILESFSPRGKFIFFIVNLNCCYNILICIFFKDYLLHILKPIKFIDTNTGCEQFVCPDGRFLGVPSNLPELSTKNINPSISWWNDKKYYIGNKTERALEIEIANALTSTSIFMRVIINKRDNFSEVKKMQKKVDKLFIYNI